MSLGALCSTHQNQPLFCRTASLEGFLQTEELLKTDLDQSYVMSRIRAKKQLRDKHNPRMGES